MCVHVTMCVYVHVCVCSHMCVHVPICVYPHVFEGKDRKQFLLSFLDAAHYVLLLLLLLYVSVISVCKIVHMSWNMCRCQRIASRSRFFPPRDGAQVVRLAQKASLPSESSH